MRNNRLFMFIALLLSVATAAVAESFYYKSYDVDVMVRKDNSFRVKERLGVFFTEPRHGIVRDFSNKAYAKRQLPDGKGGFVERVMSYTQNYSGFASDSPFELESADDYTGMRLGSAYTFVDGDHEYNIEYSLSVGDDRVNTDDLLFFSLLGQFNNVPVDSFTFAVHFEKPIPKASLEKLKMFYGNAEDTVVRNDCVTLISDTLVAGMVRGLGSNQAVTMHMPLPEGYFEYGKTDDNSSWILWIAVSAMLAIVVLIRQTKSRNLFTKTMEVWPPEGLTPADLGYIYDTKVDSHDIIALVPYFAHKGLLEIDATSGHPVLRKKAECPDSASAYERRLFNAFFENGDTFDTEQPDRKFATRWLKVPADIVKANEGMGNRYSGFIFLWLMSGVCFLMSLLAGDVTQNYAVGLYGAGVGLLMAMIGLVSLWKWDRAQASAAKRLFVFVFWAVCVMFQIMVYGSAVADQEVHLLPAMKVAYAGTYVLLLGSSLFLFRLVSMSKNRLKYIGQILGLKDFIEKSEKPMLDSLLKEHERYFYDILPYAVAFGLAEKWASRFEGLNVGQPEWYVGNDRSMNSFMAMTMPDMMLSPAMENAIAETVNRQMAAASRSSSASMGGGGFSGGGFGGGGSHSW